MKKTLIVAVIALTVLFAMTAVAFAEVETASNYTAWVSGGVNGTTPHMGFATGTTKCSVCHSVHNAADSATYVAASAENLLRSSRASACTYCHITDDISTKEPYGEDVVANYTGDTAYNHGDSSAVLGAYAGCTSCHAVHGANTYTDAAVSASILRKDSLAAPDADVVAMWAAPAGYGQNITTFCSQCHAYYDSTYDNAANVDPQHIMTTDDNVFGNSTSFNGDAATAVSTYCTSCHDSDSASVATAAFPHYQPGYARFLKSDTGAGVGNTEADAAKDGACLKCHSNAGVTF